MITKINSCAVDGLEGLAVEVETDISLWLPSFTIVGLGDAAIQESKERIRSAIKNTWFSFPAKRITINLAPAHIRKKGASFDLPIALGILGSLLSFDKNLLEKSLFVWELALDGSIRAVSSILPAILFAKTQKIPYIFIPQDNLAESQFIPNITLIPVSSLAQATDVLQKNIPITDICIKTESNTTPISTNNPTPFDFANILGQEHAKRALIISAAGGHNIIMEWPPGSGKTLLAQAMSSILSHMSEEEIIETSRIYSVAGLLNKENPIISSRPFRKIHHTASTVSIIGGGKEARPWEISLAHKGVLFLDEFLEFDKKLLEALRQPLEDGSITINRINTSYTYPCRFILVGSLNPCPCGYLNDKEKSCSCSGGQIERYRQKLSGPILDRIDLYIRVPRISTQEISQSPKERKIATSQELKELVESARNHQLKRFEGTSKTYNAEMDNQDVEKYCELEEKEKTFLLSAVQKFHLSTRAYFRVLKVARTIADIENKENINLAHLAEALGYRHTETT